MVKRIVGETFEVTADFLKTAITPLRSSFDTIIFDEKTWEETPIHHVDNDQWAGAFSLSANHRYVFTAGTYIKTYETWKMNLKKSMA